MFDYFSMMALPVKLYQDVNYLGPATAFCYEYNGNNYLVSNWHVFSGRNPDTGQPLSSTGAIPSKICILMHGIEPGSYYDEVSFELYGKNEEALWLQHQDGQTIDIAAINISELFAGPKLYFANAHEHLKDRLTLRVTDEVFITGFPRGLTKQGIFPVWKRGTIAAEPNILVDGSDATFLVDTATREGMSGSPVFKRMNKEFTDYRDDSGTTKVNITHLIGVYSGRFGGDDGLSAQLGRVWKTDKIREVLWHPSLGSYEILKRN
tara:strand:+ start:909 stop:1700 length:792 start_codon:yes stop_codon:yes gene_type:complete